MGKRTRRQTVTWASLVSSVITVMAPNIWSAPLDGEGIYLDVHGTCPSSAELERELAPLLNGWTIVDEPSAAEHRAELTDHGGSVEVSVAGDRRHLNDPARDCQERARAAAVVIALRLEPTASTAAPPSPPAPVESDVTSPHLSKPHREFEIGFGMIIQKSLDTALHPGIGPLVSARFRQGAWAAQVSLGLAGTTEIVSNDVRLRFTRLPLDVGVGWVHARGDWLLEPMALVAFDHFLVLAPDLDDARPRGRFELGPRLGFRISRRLGRLGVFGLVDVSWFPRHYVIEADPLGPVGRTPHFWLGARFGLSVPFFSQK